MHDYETYYPDSIDKKIFFSDMDLKYSETLEEFQNHLAKKEYVEASGCLQDSDADYYGAYLYNMLNRRLIAIGTVLLTKNKKKPIYYSPVEPEMISNGETWIG